MLKRTAFLFIYKKIMGDRRTRRLSFQVIESFSPVVTSDRQGTNAVSDGDREEQVVNDNEAGRVRIGGQTLTPRARRMLGGCGLIVGVIMIVIRELLSVF